MKKLITSLFLSVFCILTGCADMESKSTDKSEIPPIVFLVRTDISDMPDPEEISRGDIPDSSLGFYDRDGNYYVSDDPVVNAMDNETLAAEYEAGSLTERIRYSTSCDADFLAEQCAELREVCCKRRPEIVYPDAAPDVQAESVAWYGFYRDSDGNLQCQTIHREERMTELYTDDDTVNGIYERIIDTFHK